MFDVYGTLISSGVGDISLASESNRDASLRASLVDNGFDLTEASREHALDQQLHAIICQHQAKRRSEGVDYPEVDIRLVWQELIHTMRELIAKPSTHLYTIAANRLMKHHAIDASAVLYIGNDIRNDIWPAQKIGFKTALFAGDDRSLRRRKDDPDCSHIAPDLVLTDLSQIIDCLA